MTLILAATGKKSIWVLADTRLTYGRGVFSDSGEKLLRLETSDGVAILGYAGLGATSEGTQPSTWMANVLRGRNVPLEHALSFLATAAKSQLPPHLTHINSQTGPFHAIVAAAIVAGEPRIYTIRLQVSDDRRALGFEFNRELQRKPGSNYRFTPRFVATGSGALAIPAPSTDLDLLKKLIHRAERRQQRPQTVASFMARMNQKASKLVADKTVGKRCMVAWHIHRNGDEQESGLVAFNGTLRERRSYKIQTIQRGTDINALISLVWDHLNDQYRSAGNNWKGVRIDEEKFNESTRLLPRDPDENLR